MRDDSLAEVEMAKRLEKNEATESKVKGSIAISLMWDHSNPNYKNDLDLWVTCPSGERIGWDHKKSKCGGELDVDCREKHPDPVENIVWKENAPKGRYRISVHNFSMTHLPLAQSIPFRVTLAIDGGERKMFKMIMPDERKKWMTVNEFNYA